MRRQLVEIEKKLIHALAETRADPDAEAPLALRDQPTEIVFTALEPKKREERLGATGFLPPAQGMDSMGEVDPMVAMANEPMPPSAGEASIMNMLGGGAPEATTAPTPSPQEPPPAPPQGAREPGPAMPPGAPQGPPPGAGGGPEGGVTEEDLQDLLVMG